MATRMAVLISLVLHLTASENPREAPSYTGMGTRPGSVSKPCFQETPDYSRECHGSDNIRSSETRCKDGCTDSGCQYVDYAFKGQTVSQNLTFIHGNGSQASDGENETCFTAASDGSGSWSAQLENASCVTQVSVLVEDNGSLPVNFTVFCVVHQDKSIQVYCERECRLGSKRNIVYKLSEPTLVASVRIVTSSGTRLVLCDVNIFRVSCPEFSDYNGSNSCRGDNPSVAIDTTEPSKRLPGGGKNFRFIGPLLGISALILTFCFLATFVWKRRRSNKPQVLRRLHSVSRRLRSTQPLGSMVESPFEDRESSVCTQSLTAVAANASKTASDGATSQRRERPQSLDSVVTADAHNSLSVHAVNEDKVCNVTYDTLPTTAISVNDLPSKVAHWTRHPKTLKEERARLPSGQLAEWRIALLSRNLKKSRYRDLYPYDHSRVLLSPVPGDPYSDFYNANYIDGYNTKREFIAAQGPTGKTLQDFLRMVWDTNCPYIVMLTNLMEGGKLKCVQYWPNENSVSAGGFQISLSRLTTMADFCIRELIFEQGSKRRLVTMFHYTAWPDNSTPTSPWSLLDFRHKVRQTARADGPTIVHCSAGIGRTGTYLALDILLSQALHKNTVDVFQCVWNLRQQRTSMVQTQTQYNFIYEVLVAAMMTPPPVSAERYNMSFLLSETTRTKSIHQEFQNMNMCLEMVREPGHEHEDMETAGQHVPPVSEKFLVAVYCVDDECTPLTTDSLFISSCRQQNAFIQARTPTKDDVVNFLSIVCQHHVTLIVCLDTFWEQIHAAIFNRTCHVTRVQGAVYTAEEEGTSLTFDPYRIELLRIRADDWMTRRTLRIYLPRKFNNNDQGECTDWDAETFHDVKQISCFDWPDSFLAPEAVSMLLPIVTAARLHPRPPVLVHCRDGYSRSGVFCILAGVLERLQMDKEVAVSYVTARMRVPRPQNIVSSEQYEFLYRCVEHYISFAEAEDTVYSQPTARERSWHVPPDDLDPVYANFLSAETAAPYEEEDFSIYGNIRFPPR